LKKYYKASPNRADKFTFLMWIIFVVVAFVVIIQILPDLNLLESTAYFFVWFMYGCVFTYWSYHLLKSKVKIDDNGIISIPGKFNFTKINSFRYKDYYVGVCLLKCKFYVDNINDVYRIKTDEQFSNIIEKRKSYVHVKNKYRYSLLSNSYLDKVICIEFINPLEKVRELLDVFGKVRNEPPIKELYLTLDEPDIFIEDVKKLKTKFSSVRSVI